MAFMKNSKVALALSLVVPGSGQIYNEEYTKGCLVSAGCIFFGGGALWFTGAHRGSLLLALLVVWLSAILDAYRTAQASGQPLDWHYRPSYVIPMLLLVGPLALPLLWRSPYFSSIARSGWTIVVVGGAILFLTTPYLIHFLAQRVPEFAALLQQSGVNF
jgi:hypothetical protein